MKNRYSDASTRPHSALVGSPFRNVVKRFDADIVRSHHVTAMRSATTTIRDEPDPIFQQILDRRGYDPAAHSSSSPSSRPVSPDGGGAGGSAAGSPASMLRRGGGDISESLRRQHAIGGGGGGGAGSPGVNDTGFNTSGAAGAISGSSDFKFRRSTSPSKKKKSGRRSASPPSSAAVYTSGTASVFSAHKQKVHAMAQKQRMRDDSDHRVGGGAASKVAESTHKVSVSDAGLFRASAGGGGAAESSPNRGGGGGGISASPWGGGGAAASSSASRGRNNSPGSPTSGRRPGSASPQSGSRGSPNRSAGAGRPQFGTSSPYQRWSNSNPGFGPGGDAFAGAMRGSVAVMDDAETIEVRREIQGAIDAFLYRPVARRFAEETSKWVEDHVLPFANVASSSSSSPIGGGGGGGGGGRPDSAASRSTDTTSSRSAVDRVADVNIAARRQKTLALTEEVLPLLFHHIAQEVRDVVRLRIEAALLKKETRISYL